MGRPVRIAVVGGGPGGLTLARVLHRHQVAATVFDRDDHEGARPQGGTLDLHADAGQHAVRLAGLGAEFRAVARYEDQGMRVLDERAAVRFEQADPSAGDRPEVDRTALRRLLLRSLPAGTVRWGHRLRAVVPHPAGGYEVAFENGSAGVFDLVVGADGARSRVRPLVSDATPAYSGVTFVELSLPDADRRFPAESALVGRGTMFAVGPDRAIIGHRCGGGLVHVYVALRVDRGWPAAVGLGDGSPADDRAILAAQFAGWSPRLLGLIAAGADRIVARPIVALPVGHRWTNRPGVTLLGDAAHVMSPFGGDGANLAMLDAADLADALTADGDWADAVAAYERVMLNRAEAAARGAAEGIAAAISPDGLDHMLRHVRSHG